MKKSSRDVRKIFSDMRKIVIATIFVCVLITIICIVVSNHGHRLNITSSRYSELRNELVLEIDRYREKNGSYPKHLSDLSGNCEIITSDELYFLINNQYVKYYLKLDTSNNYEYYVINAPIFGHKDEYPGSGYDSRRKSWHYDG